MSAGGRRRNYAACSRAWPARAALALDAARLIDAKDCADDDAADGNLALALDAASAEGLLPALERVAALFSAVDDQELWRSFVAWCGGILSPRLGDRLPALVDDKKATMLAETLRERDEMKIDEGRRQGMRAGGPGAKRCWRRNGRCCAAWPPDASTQPPAPSWPPFSPASRMPRNWRGSAR